MANDPLDPFEYGEYLDDCYAKSADQEQDLFNNDLRYLLKVCNRITQIMPAGAFPEELHTRLTNAADNVECWLDREDDDPRSNGWVGQDGKP